MTKLSTPLNFLCIEDDADFIELIQLAAFSHNIIIQFASTIKEARELLAISAFDAYLIDLYLPDGTALDIISIIKAKVIDPCPVVVISGFIRDENLINKLYALQIDYLLEKPIAKDDLKMLLERLSEQRRMTREALKTNDKVRQLKIKYDKTIIDKISLLSLLVKEVNKNASNASLLELRNHIHKIGGSAGSYGYSKVSDHCKELEFVLNNIVENQAPIMPNINELLDRFIENIKIDYQCNTSGAFFHEDKEEVVHLYLIDEDEKLLDEIKEKALKQSLHVEIEKNFFWALDRLKSNDFNPQVVIFGQNNFSSMNSFQAFTSAVNHKAFLSIFGLILAEDTIETRLDAVQSGINLFFRRPVDASLLLQTVSDLTGQLKGVKALVLDDDHDICEFISNALEEIGIEVRILQKASQLIDTLNTFKPQIFLLDILLPEYNGLKLLQSLRGDPLYQNLIIIIVSQLQDYATQRLAYNANANEVLQKPLDKTSLQKRILYLIKTLNNVVISSSDIKKEEESPNSQPSTSLSLLTEKLQKKIHATSSSEDLDLVLFEFDPFTEKNTYKDKQKIRALLQKKALACIPFHDNIEIFVLENCPENKAEEIILETMSQCSLEVPINCSIVPITEEFKNVTEIFRTAEIALNMARHKKASPVRIFTHKSNQSISRDVLNEGFNEISENPDKESNEIILVDPDQDLVRLVKAALEFHHFTVTTYNEGGAALRDLLSRNKESFPALIIVERKLPDMDGINLLIQLKSHFQKIPPFYFLTIFSSDKDISEGLKLGAKEYISKPINLALFIQKIIKSQTEAHALV